MRRKEALALGIKTYNGKPCVKCLGTTRQVSTSGCVPCGRESARIKAKARYAKNPDLGGHKNRKAKYGMTQEQFEAMWVGQGGQCAICFGALALGKAGHAVDHCHSTLRVRGLLCTLCNTGIGHLREDPAIFAAALAYLQIHRSAL